MPPVSVIATIFVVHWLLTMTPGPNAVLVAQTAVASRRANAFAVIAGICASGAIWVTSAAYGLKAVFLAFPWLYAFVSYAGAAYLVWLGIKLLRSKSKAVEGQPIPGVPQRLLVSFARGFVSNITNPKALVYFSSVFGTFMPPDAGPGTVVAVVLMTWTCNFGWYGSLSLLRSCAPALLRSCAPALGRPSQAAVWPHDTNDQPRGRDGDDPVRVAGGGCPPTMTQPDVRRRF